MTAEIEALARHRLSRAREALAEGEILLLNESHSGAVNRFYYGAFHAARALLATRQVDSPRHSGVISLFQKHFVKSGVITPDSARALPRAFEKRQKGDYGDFATYTAEEAQHVRDDVRAFIDSCAAALERILATAKE